MIGKLPAAPPTLRPKPVARPCEKSKSWVAAPAASSRELCGYATAAPISRRVGRARHVRDCRRGAALDAGHALPGRRTGNPLLQVQSRKLFSRQGFHQCG